MPIQRPAGALKNSMKKRKVKWQDTQPEHEVENKVASTVNEKRIKHAEGTVAGKELSLQRINGLRKFYAKC
jgi:hypothetical protein